MAQIVSGWAAYGTSGTATPFSFERRENGDNDVTIEILYCGICHSDLSHVRNEWNTTVYPMVPGHEITGVITKVGSNVTEFSVGDRVGVGYIASTCRICEACVNSEENYCEKYIATDNGTYYDDRISYGGYSQMIVADYRYVVPIPDNLPLDATAPLLCAGVSAYSAMKDHNLHVLPEKKIGVLGLGGIGHMAVKFGKLWGHHVTVISTSPAKEEAAMNSLGADAFLLSFDAEQVEKEKRTFDFIINTLPVQHSLEPTLELLKLKGTMVVVGEPPEPIDLPPLDLAFGKRAVKGSIIGSNKETREMLDLCAQHNIVCDIELITPDKIDEALNRVDNKDIRFRFVIDIGNAAAEADTDAGAGTPSN